MICKAKDMYTFETPAPCGGSGLVRCTCFLSEELSYGAGRGFTLCTMPEGSACGVHGHTGECEMYLILSGSARITDNGDEHILEPGDMSLCQDGGTHSIENIGKGDLKYISLIFHHRKKADA